MKKLIAVIKDKERLHRILFEGTDPLSKPVDITIMVAIVLCIVIASLESVLKVDDFSFQTLIHLELNGAGILKASIIVLEYILSILFAIEYVLRVYCSPVKREYVLSFFGIIDLMATWPQLLSIFFPPLRYLAIMRTFHSKTFMMWLLTPLHDEFRKKRRWSDTQTVYRFAIVQLLCALAGLLVMAALR